MKTRLDVFVTAVGLLAAAVLAAMGLLATVHRFAYARERTAAVAPGLVRSGPHATMPPEPLKILVASYNCGSECADVTGRVKELLSTGGVLWANPGCLHADPHPYLNKALVIVYEAQGKPAVLSVGENEEVSRERLLQNARSAADKAIAQTDSHS